MYFEPNLNLNTFRRNYKELEEQSKIGLKKLKEVIEEMSKQTELIKIEKENDFSVKFHFYGYRFLIKFMKNISEGKGCFRFFYLYYNYEEQKKATKNILEYTFDESGNIYQDKNSITHFGKELTNFLANSLMKCCSKIDKEMYSEF